MHSEKTAEPPLAPVPASSDFLLLLNYKEVPCSFGSSLPSTKVTKIGSDGRRACQSCRSLTVSESQNLQSPWLMLVPTALVAAILHTRLYKAQWHQGMPVQNPLVGYLYLAKDPPWLPLDVVVALIVVFALCHVTNRLENVFNDRDLAGLRPQSWLVGYKLRRRLVRCLIGTLAQDEFLSFHL